MVWSKVIEPVKYLFCPLYRCLTWVNDLYKKTAYRACYNEVVWKHHEEISLRMPAISHFWLFWKCSIKIVPKLVWEIIIYFWVKSKKVTMKKDCHFMIFRNNFLILTKKFIMTSRTWTELGKSSIFLSSPSYFKMKKATLTQRPIKMPLKLILN